MKSHQSTNDKRLKRQTRSSLLAPETAYRIDTVHDEENLDLEQKTTNYNKLKNVDLSVYLKHYLLSS